MRVMIVHNFYEHTGGEDLVVQAESALLRGEGHDVAQCFSHSAHIREYSVVRKMALGASTVWSSAAFHKIRAAINRFQPDVVHLHNTLPLISPSAYYACRSAGVAVVQTLHNYRLTCPSANLFRDGRTCELCVGRGMTWPGVVHRCYRGSRAQTIVVSAMLGVHRLAGTWKNLIHVYVALTEFGRRKLIEAGLPAEKIVVKPNCLLNDPGERAGRGDYALFAGRLSDEKGIGTLIRAWERLDGIPLTILGDGPLRELVQSSALRLRRASIRFMGFQQRDVVLEMMRSARFLVFPSECYEGFPLTLLEAFASGLPVIGAAHGAVAEIIMRDAAGLLFTPGDDQALASTVQMAWDSPDRTTELGRRARKAYEGRYTGAKNRGQLLEIYAKAMAARDAGRVHH